MNIRTLSLSALGTFTLLSLPSCVVPTNGYVGNGYVRPAAQVSTSIRVLPRGYKTFYVSGNPYYNYGSTWYRRSSHGYIRCSRPHGYSSAIRHNVSHSPISRYQSTIINGNRYYYQGNNWFQRSGNSYCPIQRPTQRYHSSHQRPNQPYYQHRSHNQHNSSQATPTRRPSTRTEASPRSSRTNRDELVSTQRSSSRTNISSSAQSNIRSTSQPFRLPKTSSSSKEQNLTNMLKKLKKSR